MIDDGTPTDDTLPVDPTKMGALGDASRGRIVGRFTVIDVLGQGAMGVVLAAYDPDLDRKVALKLLRPDAFGTSSAATEGAERMLREARAMAKLSHPNVLAIHEAGSVDGSIFLAMEFAGGGTLRAWCTAKKRPWREVLGKFIQAGRGLAAAHDAGLVHRDFKPANVMLAKNDEARVADFGLVGVHTTMVDPEGDGDDAGDADTSVSLTRTGAILGTPAYMAPEQHDRADVGPAADQFAFCVSLWEALFGMPPFEGTTVRTLGENVRANKVVAPPSTAESPAWLATVIRRGLSREPGERWPSMSALIAELERDPAASRRRRLGWLAAIGAGTLLVGGMTAFAMTREHAGPSCAHMDRNLAGVWDPARRSGVRAAFVNAGGDAAAGTYDRVAKELDGYTTSWITARRETCEATHVHGDQSEEELDLEIACLDRRLVAVTALVDVLSVPTPEVLERAIVATTRLPNLAECADSNALRATTTPPADIASRVQVDAFRRELAAAKALADTGQHKLGRGRAAELVERADRLGYAPLRAEALHRRGVMERLDGDAAGAEKTFETALQAAADAHEDRLAAEVWTEQLYVLGELLQRPADALLLRPAAEAALRRAGNDPATTGNYHANLGRVYFNAGKFAAAQESLEKAIAIKERVSGKDSFDVARSLTSLGNAFYEQSKYDEALARHERALVIWRSTFGDEHPDVLAIETNIANVLHSTGKYADARKRYERILEPAKKVLGPEHHRVADIMTNLANTLREMNELDASAAAYRQTIEIYTKAFGDKHADIARTIGDLGRVHLDAGRLADARSHFERSLAMFEALKWGETLEASVPVLGLAAVHLAEKRPAQALPLAERALKLRETQEGGPEEVEAARLIVGTALLGLGRDRERGVSLVTEARDFFAKLGDAGRKRVEDADRVLAAHKR